MAELDGKRMSATDRFINFHSKLTHTEEQFGLRYKYVSFSNTMADDCRCCRFKMIMYSHPIRWNTVESFPTDHREDMMWAKACQLADLPIDWLEDANLMPNTCFYGDKAIKYDLIGLASHKGIGSPDEVKMWCTEAVYVVKLVGWPDILKFPAKTLRPDDLAPDMGDWIARYYFQKRLDK